MEHPREKAVGEKLLWKVSGTCLGALYERTCGDWRLSANSKSVRVCKYSVAPALTVRKDVCIKVHELGWYRRVIGPFAGMEDSAFFVSYGRKFLSYILHTPDKVHLAKIVCHLTYTSVRSCHTIFTICSLYVVFSKT